MRRDGTVQRVANEVCWAIAAGAGPYTDFSHIEPAVEIAVWLCMMDAPHGGQLADDPSALLASRIRVAVAEVLRTYHAAPDWIERVGEEIESAAYLAITGRRRSGPANGQPAASR